MKRSWWQITIFFLACLRIGMAQTNAPLRLSLGQSVERALAQNPEAQIADLQVAESQQDRKIARSALLPNVSLEASESIRRLNVETLIGHELPAFGPVSGPFQAMVAGTTFSTPIFDLRLWKQYRATKDRVAASRADAQTRREEISLLVVSQYLGVLRATAGVDASKSRVDLAKALLDQTKALHQSGVATRVDEVRAEVRLRQEAQRLIVAQTDVSTALYALARLLNIPAGQSIEITDHQAFFDTSGIPPEATIEMALRNRPELAFIRARRSAAESEHAAASAARFPSLRFQGAWEIGRAHV